MMSRMLRESLKWLAPIALLVLIATSAFGQGAMPADLIEAKDLFESGEYIEALATVEGYLATDPDGRYSSAAQILAGRCEVRLHRGLAATQRALAVLDRFGNDGPMAAQAYYLLATANQEAGDEYEAARALINALDCDPEPALSVTIRAHLRNLLSGPVAYKSQSLLRLPRSEAVRDTLRSMLPLAAKRPTIGLLVPEYRRDNSGGPAEELVAGVKAAINQYLAATGNEVDLVIRRTPGDAPHAVEDTRQLVRQVGVWGLIAAGPEPLVVAATVEAQAAEVPVILPGQRRPGLGALGPTAVLPETDWRHEGELLANYALDSLHLRSVAVVAPYTDRGLEIVQGFTQQVDSTDSAQVLVMEWYFPEEGVSLSSQFQRIRTLGFRLQYEDTLLAQGRMLPHDFAMPPFPGDSARLYATVPILDTLFRDDPFLIDTVIVDTVGMDTVLVDTLALTAEDSLDSDLMEWLRLRRIAPFDSLQYKRYWNARMDSIKRTAEYKTGLIDSNDIELDVYDALLAIIEPNGIPVFAPQFAFYNFKTTHIGNDAWYNPDILYKNRQYVDELVFTSPYYLRADNPKMSSLRRGLGRSEGSQISPWHIRGADAARILLEQVDRGRIGPQDVGEGIRQVDSLSLASGLQTFSDRQMVGQRMWLLTFRNTSVVPESTQVRWEILHPPAPPDTMLFDPDNPYDYDPTEE